MIECLQQKGGSQTHLDSHYLSKYRELENYMN